MNVSLYLACGKTVPGYSVNVTKQENFDMPIRRPTTGLTTTGHHLPPFFN